MPAGGIRFKNQLNLVAHTAKLVENFIFGSRGMGRIIEAPMVAVQLTREHGAGLVGIATDRYDRIDGAVQKLLEMLGVMGRDIDADLLHYFDRLWVNVTGRFGAGAGDFNEVAGSGAEDALGKVTPARVTCAEDEDEWFGVHR